MKEPQSGTGAQAGTVEALVRVHARTQRCQADLLTLLAELDIHGLARFLSHADLQRALKRCCVRARLRLRYSQGFNPRPKMSLPLPKPVGLASCGDVLCARLEQQGDELPDTVAQSRLCQALGAQLPSGMTLRTLHVTPGKLTLYPRAFSLRLTLQPRVALHQVEMRIAEFMAQERLLIERKNPDKPHKTKHIDIRPFISSIAISQQTLRINCLVHNAGSIRVEEILMSLGLDRGDMDGPVQRDHLTWQLQ